MNGLPPCLRLPPWVQLLWWAYRPLSFLDHCRRRYGDTFTVRFPAARIFVMTSDPQAIRAAFTAPPASYQVRDANRLVKPLLGEGSLLLLDGERHLRERKMMMPPFHGERMQIYTDAMRDVTAAAADGMPRDVVVPLHHTMQTITLDVIVRTVFGVEDAREFNDLRGALTRLLALAANPMSLLLSITGEIRVPLLLRPLVRFLPIRHFERMKLEADALLYALIARRREEVERGRTDTSVLGMLLAATDEAGARLSDRELRDEMMTLLVAGHETSATTLCWAFSHVAGHPPVLERLCRELREVVGDEPLSSQHVGRLTYLDAVLRESLRLTPILPLVGRRLLQPLQAGRYELPAGASLAPCILLTHRRPDLWPEPLAFQPERFLDERIPPYAWFPFGGGVRRCLGMAFAMHEMKVIMATMLRRLSLRTAPGYVPHIVRRGITLAPSQGAPFIASERSLRPQAASPRG